MIINNGLQSYGIGIALTLAAYYLAVYMLLAHRKTLQIKTRKQALTILNSIQTSLFEGQKESHLPKLPEQSTEQIAYNCIDELNAYLDEMKRVKCNKVDLIKSLKRIIAKYPSLKSSDYKESLNNMLVVQCENMCSVRLSADDMVHVWY